MKMVLVVAVALLDADNRVLIAKRSETGSMPGLWEFPGGKIEPNETPEMAILREMKEELDIETKEACLAPLAFASHSYESFHLLMPLYVCRRWQGIVRPLVHQEVKWVRPQALRDYEMPAADLPLIAHLCDLL